ncbi:TonB-dependent receptor [uncultured Thiodictyon sp.]|uniref:TonB-dependent receptor n=1 Tax=uncultured Thiodictyon sp. TaxID=1846217 RepID=UPI0025E0C444|nr:TonB-dependent receptor [uncultured Thiodictyon sp.]
MLRKIERPTQQDPVAQTKSKTSAGRGRRLILGTAAVTLSASILAPGQAFSADDKVVAELQAEIARLRQELAAAKGLPAQTAPVAEPQGAAGAAPTRQAAVASPKKTPASKKAPAGSKAEAPASDTANPGGSTDGAGFETLDAVVIRARNREERLQTVPIPVSVVTGQTLLRENGHTLAAVADRASNVKINQSNARQSSATIRGLGKQGQTDAMETSVGVMVDNVFYSYSAFSFQNLVDIDQVEVLRGPQGTLMGKNTNLGALVINTKMPSFTPEYFFQGEAGERNSYFGQASATGPVIDGLLAYRASFNVERLEGERTNVYSPQQSYSGNRDRLAGRFQLLFTPAPELQARFIVDILPKTLEGNTGSVTLGWDPLTFASGASRIPGSRGAPANLSARSVRFTERLSRDWFSNRISGFQANDVISRPLLWTDAQNPVQNGQFGASAEVDWEVLNHTITSISAYRDVSFDARNDFDNTPFSVTYNWNTDAHFKQFSQEFRLTSKLGGPIDYQAGLFYLENQNQTNLKGQYGPDAGAFYATDAQYARLNANAAGRSLLSDSLNYIQTVQSQWPRTRSLAGFGQLNWHFTEKGTLTLGARLTQENRFNNINNVLLQKGPGDAIAADNDAATAILLFGPQATLANRTRAQQAQQLAAANAAALKYFGTATYAGLTAAQQNQLKDATAIRSSQLGTYYGITPGIPLNSTAPSLLFSPSWKLSDNIFVYASVSYGEKSGLVYFNTTDGTPQNAKPEKVIDYELGIKNSLLDNTLVLNVNLYQTDVTDYQQQLQTADPLSSTGWRTVTGNVPKVQLRGIEYDTSYTGFKHWNLRASGAFISAVYKDFKNAGAPAEVSDVATVVDLTGRTLPGASKVSGNFGAEYRLPIRGGNVFHSSFNTVYQSASNVAVDLSSYGQIPGYSTTDFTIGVGAESKRWDLNIVAQNVFDQRYVVAGTAFNKAGTGIASTTYAPGRFVGVVWTAKF